MTDNERLIKEIGKYEVLYNTQLPQCRDLTARNDAWKEISEEMNMSVEDLKETWNKLRNSYANAIKRRVKCKKKNKTMPPWRYEAAMSYLKPFIRHDYTSDGTVLQYFDIEEDNPRDSGSFSYSVKEEDILNVQRKRSVNSNASDSDYLVGCKTEAVYFENDDISEEELVEMPRKRPREELSQKILDGVEDISRRLPTKQDDEVDSFAKYIATTLRTLSPANSIKAKLELQTALARIQLIDVEERSGK